MDSEHESDDIEVDTNMKIHSLATNLPMSNKRKQKVQCATAKDKAIVKLSQTIADGWSRHRSDCDPLIRQYWPIRDELHVIQGVVYAPERVVIPNSMRSEILQKLHESHSINSEVFLEVPGNVCFARPQTTCRSTAMK